MDKAILEQVQKTIAEVKEALKGVPNKEQIEKAIADAAAKVVKSRFEFSVEEHDEALAKGAAFLTKSSSDSKVKEFQQKCDDLYLTSKILRVDPRQLKMWKGFAGSELKKAMDAGTSAEGSEWVPTVLSAELIDLVRLELKVAALHTTINMPSNPFDLPVVASDATGYLVPEQTADVESATRITASTPGTGKVTLTAKKLGARVVFSEELREDSVVPVLPFIKSNMARALADAIERATIDGDTTATHQDSDVTASTEFRKAWNGYRKLAVSSVKNDLSNADVAASDIAFLRGEMGKYGISPNDLAIVVSPVIYAKLIKLAEVITIDKYGPNATILTGELAKIWGIPVIVSSWVRDNLNASGVYDGSTTNRGLVIVVNRRQMIYGDKRQITVKTFEDIQTDQTIVVATQRLAFSRTAPAADTYVGMLYNVKTT